MLRRASTFQCALRSSHALRIRHVSYIVDDTEAKSFRNIALVAHIDSGKTTLTESILHKSSFISSPGSVDTGSTTTDFLPAERERGITIQAASVPVKWKDWLFNLIDTPGHADFGMEVESASRVVDGAVVVIDSVEGVESQTKGVWKQLDRYDVPTRLMFFNKLDRPGASFRSSLLSLLSHRLHPKPMILTLPIASFDSRDYGRAEPGLQGLVDLVTWTVWKWSEDGSLSQHSLPKDIEGLSDTSILPKDHPLNQHLVPARTALLENLAMLSEEFMLSLLDMQSGPSTYLNIDGSTIMPHLRKATLRRDLLPVLCGSAMKGIGTEILMNYVGELLASPADVAQQSEGPYALMRALVWKVAWHPQKGWMTFVRVYAGSVLPQKTVINVSNGEKERTAKLFVLYANEEMEVDKLPFGSVGVILGLKHTRTGDTLSAMPPSRAKTPTPLRQITPPPALVSASVIPLTYRDTPSVQHALKSLIRTDPSVLVDEQDDQILIHGLGALHLEIVEGRLRDEYSANFEFGPRRVNYREGLGDGQSDVDTWSFDLAGQWTTIKVGMTLEALAPDEDGDPEWEGNVLMGPDGKKLRARDKHNDEREPSGFIARGIMNALSNSPHTSLPLTRVKIQIQDSQYPPGMRLTYLTGASAYILNSRLKEIGMGPLLEPYADLKIFVNEDNLGKVIKDVTENGGEVLDLQSDASTTIPGQGEIGPYSTNGVYVPPDELSPSSASSNASNSAISGVKLKRTVHALAPLSKLLDYSARLRALSGGHGTFEMSIVGFREVNEQRKLEILREIGRM